MTELKWSLYKGNNVDEYEMYLFKTSNNSVFIGYVARSGEIFEYNTDKEMWQTPKYFIKMEDLDNYIKYEE